MEAKQRTLFPLTYTLHPRDPNIDVQDVPRVAGQNAALLARLQHGPATNDELIRISPQVHITHQRPAGSRLHDCVRAAQRWADRIHTDHTDVRTDARFIRHMT
jgi:hypothetical protein